MDLQKKLGKGLWKDDIGGMYLVFGGNIGLHTEFYDNGRVGIDFRQLVDAKCVGDVVDSGSMSKEHVEFLFDNTDSIDVLIRNLQAARDAISSPQNEQADGNKE